MIIMLKKILYFFTLLNFFFIGYANENVSGDKIVENFKDQDPVFIRTKDSVEKNIFAIKKKIINPQNNLEVLVPTSFVDEDGLEISLEELRNPPANVSYKLTDKGLKDFPKIYSFHTPTEGDLVANASAFGFYFGGTDDRTVLNRVQIVADYKKNNLEIVPIIGAELVAKNHSGELTLLKLNDDQRGREILAISPDKEKTTFIDAHLGEEISAKEVYKNLDLKDKLNITLNNKKYAVVEIGKQYRFVEIKKKKDLDGDPDVLTVGELETQDIRLPYPAKNSAKKSKLFKPDSNDAVFVLEDNTEVWMYAHKDKSNTLYLYINKDGKIYKNESVLKPGTKIKNPLKIGPTLSLNDGGGKPVYYDPRGFYYDDENLIHEISKVQQGPIKLHDTPASTDPATFTMKDDEDEEVKFHPFNPDNEDEPYYGYWKGSDSVLYPPEKIFATGVKINLISVQEDGPHFVHDNKSEMILDRRGFYVEKNEKTEQPVRLSDFKVRLKEQLGKFKLKDFDISKFGDPAFKGKREKADKHFYPYREAPFKDYWVDEDGYLYPPRKAIEKENKMLDKLEKDVPSLFLDDPDKNEGPSQIFLDPIRGFYRDSEGNPVDHDDPTFFQRVNLKWETPKYISKTTQSKVYEIDFGKGHKILLNNKKQFIRRQVVTPLFPMVSLEVTKKNVLHEHDISIYRYDHETRKPIKLPLGSQEGFELEGLEISKKLNEAARNTLSRDEIAAGLNGDQEVLKGLLADLLKKDIEGAETGEPKALLKVNFNESNKDPNIEKNQDYYINAQDLVDGKVEIKAGGTKLNILKSLTLEMFHRLEEDFPEDDPAKEMGPDDHTQDLIKNLMKEIRTGTGSCESCLFEDGAKIGDVFLDMQKVRISLEKVQKSFDNLDVEQGKKILIHHELCLLEKFAKACHKTTGKSLLDRIAEIRKDNPQSFLKNDLLNGECELPENVFPLVSPEKEELAKQEKPGKMDDPVDMTKKRTNAMIDGIDKSNPPVLLNENPVNSSWEQRHPIAPPRTPQSEGNSMMPMMMMMMMMGGGMGGGGSMGMGMGMNPLEMMMMSNMAFGGRGAIY